MLKMNVSSVLTKDYERNDIFAVPENKANSNRIKPNFSLTQIPQTPQLTAHKDRFYMPLVDIFGNVSPDYLLIFRQRIQIPLSHFSGNLIR